MAARKLIRSSRTCSALLVLSLLHGVGSAAEVTADFSGQITSWESANAFVLDMGINYATAPAFVQPVAIPVNGTIVFDDQTFQVQSLSITQSAPWTGAGNAGGGALLSDQSEFTYSGFSWLFNSANGELRQQSGVVSCFSPIRPGNFCDSAAGPPIDAVVEINDPVNGNGSSLDFRGIPSGFAIAAGAVPVPGTPYAPVAFSFGGPGSGDSVLLAMTTTAGLTNPLFYTATFSSAEIVLSNVSVSGDSTPDAFAFIAQTEVPLGAQVVSNAVTISGIDIPAPISVTGGEYSIDGQPFTSSPDNVTDQASVRVRITAAATAASTTSATLTVGGVASVFSVTTVTSGPVAPDVSIVKNVLDATSQPITTANVGDTISYRISVSNNEAMRDVDILVTDNLPVGVTYVGDSGGYDPVSGIWNAGVVGSGQTSDLSIDALVETPASGVAMITNTAVLTAAGGFALNQTASAEFGVGGGDAELSFLAVENDSGAAMARALAGQVATFRYVLRNIGSDVIAAPLVVTLSGSQILKLEDLRLIDSASGTDIYSAAASACTVGPASTQCELPVSVAEGAVLEILARFLVQGAFGQTETITAVLAVAGFDPDLSNNSASGSLQLATGTVTTANSGNSSCFIATAAYGSYLDPHVEALREFRDQNLLTNPIGRKLVSFYYRISPPIARAINASEVLKVVVRAALTPVVLLLSSPPWAAPLCAIGMLLCAFGIQVWRLSPGPDWVAGRELLPRCPKRKSGAIG